MNYRMTLQYARGIEKLIAEFNDRSVMRAFALSKLSSPVLSGKKLILREYDETQLLHEFNKEQLPRVYADYADGSRDVSQESPFYYRVALRAFAAASQEDVAQFAERDDAYLFVDGQFAANQTRQDRRLYFIYKDKVLIDTLNKQADLSSKGGMENGPLFKPTPLNMRPKPPGVLSDFWVEDDSDDKR